GEEAGADAVQQAYDLLQRVRHSDVARWIAEAEEGGEVYREQPFVYMQGARQIHGVIDLLLHMPDGRWLVIDYKTSRVDEGAPLASHARRYHLQLGVYAAAVRELIGAAPQVYVHYIRYAKTVQIQLAQWQAALLRFETDFE